MARIGVLEFEQSPDSSPFHFVAKELALRFLAYLHNGRSAVHQINAVTLRIAVDDITFRELKGRLKGREIPRPSNAKRNQEDNNEQCAIIPYVGRMPRVEVRDTKLKEPASGRITWRKRRNLIGDANAFGACPNPVLALAIERAYSLTSE
jgi:hypothetical protein